MSTRRLWPCRIHTAGGDHPRDHRAGGPAEAQQFSLDLGSEAGPLSGRILQLVALITIITLAPSLLVVVTSFTVSSSFSRSCAAPWACNRLRPTPSLSVSRCF